MMFKYSGNKTTINISNENFLSCYEKWETPTVIISDGPYGVNGYPGDLHSPDNLAKWYEPFIDAWSQAATPETTLWFWNTEIGWAVVHNSLVEKGWDFVNCHIWDKGLGHIAGNVNSKTIRQFPIVTEVCAQYVRRAEFDTAKGKIGMKEWLRNEWERTGLPLYRTNEACGVANAASRKYFTKCHLWYYPPAEAFEKIVNYANNHGEKSGIPYFSIDGIASITKANWAKMRAKFNSNHGITNVWRLPPLNGSERIKNGNKAVHTNQKPLKLMKLSITASSDELDVIWEPFGGLCSAAVACFDTHRTCYSSEIDLTVFNQAIKRLKDVTSQHQLNHLSVA